MASLVEFLLARIEEEEGIAQTAAYTPSEPGEHWSPVRSAEQGGAWDITVQDQQWRMAWKMNMPTAEHIARWDPARVLAECGAKRKIVELHSGRWDCPTCAKDEEFSEDSEGGGEWYRSAITSPCPTLRLLGLPYSSHPDYQETWRP